MDSYLVWLLLGFALLIVELLSGTFYLLMLGVSAFGGAAVAYYHQPFHIQMITVAVVASVGCWLVHLYHARTAKRQMRPLDVSQAVKFESWVDQGARTARVRYRGAPWEARVEGEGPVEPGASLYIIAADGNTLTVGRTRPA